MAEQLAAQKVEPLVVPKAVWLAVKMVVQKADLTVVCLVEKMAACLDAYLVVYLVHCLADSLAECLVACLVVEKGGLLAVDWDCR